MKFWIILISATFGMTLNAQDVLVNGVNYEVKNKKILKEGIDVTSTLSEEEKSAIFLVFYKKMDKVKELERVEKNLKKAEKQQKKAEKRQKKAEKALKQKEKAQTNHEKSNKQYKSALKKYEKLKDKGKLSPKDEKKWLERIKKLKEAQVKAKKKLK